MMQDQKTGLSQTTLLLRLLCGGYLVYLGAGLLEEGSPLFLGAAAVFIAVGAGLALLTLRAGWRSWKTNAPEDAGSDGGDESEDERP